jgi:hypothetical protein
MSLQIQLTIKICKKTVGFRFFYHGLGGFDSSFHDSGTIIRKVTETVPPDAEGVMVLKNTSMRSLTENLRTTSVFILRNGVNLKYITNIKAVPSCVLNIFAVGQSSAECFRGVNESVRVEVRDLPSIIARGVATQLTFRCI